MKKLLIAATLLFLSACAGAPQPLDVEGVYDTGSVQVVELTADVTRIVDTQAGVVCYTFDSGSYAGGISCFTAKDIPAAGWENIK